MKAILGNIITGGTEIGRKAVCYEGDKIFDILDVDQLSANYPYIESDDFEDHFVAAGFIDLQINGAGGKLFQAVSTKADFLHAQSSINEGGTVYYLPCISSTDLESYVEIRKHLQPLCYDYPQMLGLNFEGPFISKIRPGFGRTECIGNDITAHRDIYYDLLDDMVVMMTVAPEVLSREAAIEMLQDGVILSFGHTDASALECQNMIEIGVRNATHIFNGMPAIKGRETGLTGVCLESPKVNCTVICDGFHVSEQTMRLIWRTKRQELLSIITDGMPQLGSTDTSFTFNHIEISAEGEKLRDKNGNPSGTKLTQLDMCRIFQEATGARTDELIDTVTRGPARAIRQDREIGDIQVGRKASFSVFSKKFEAIATFCEGVRCG